MQEKELRFNLNDILNPDCLTNCDREKRKKITNDNICNELSSVVDGLPIRCVRSWAKEKIYLLTQYFGIFAQGMYKLWENNIVYIEICSGPGRCIDRESGFEFDGTPLTIIKKPEYKYIKKALFFDFDLSIVDTLNKRLNNNNNAVSLYGDYNNPDDLCKKINQEVPGKNLYFVFIDPTDCSIPFSTIMKIKENLRSVDLLINIATGTDFNRNAKNIINNPDSYKMLINKYEYFLNSEGIFKNDKFTRLVENNDNENIRNYFREIYQQSLENIGYNFFDYTPIEHYYDLLFASASKTGLSLWKKATKSIDVSGQRSLFI